MSIAQTHESTFKKPLRLWPGVVAAVLLGLIAFGIPLVSPDNMIFAVLGSVVMALVILVWWVFFSRAPWSERLGVILLMIVTLVATRFVVHESIRGGMMGMMLWIYAIPGLSVALVVWVVASRRLAAGPRRAAMVAAILLACGVWTLLRVPAVPREPLMGGCVRGHRRC